MKGAEVQAWQLHSKELLQNHTADCSRPSCFCSWTVTVPPPAAAEVSVPKPPSSTLPEISVFASMLGRMDPCSDCCPVSYSSSPEWLILGHVPVLYFQLQQMNF